MIFLLKVGFDDRHRAVSRVDFSIRCLAYTPIDFLDSYTVVQDAGPNIHNDILDEGKAICPGDILSVTGPTYIFPFHFSGTLQLLGGDPQSLSGVV